MGRRRKGLWGRGGKVPQDPHQVALSGGRRRLLATPERVWEGGVVRWHGVLPCAPGPGCHQILITKKKRGNAYAYALIRMEKWGKCKVSGKPDTEEACRCVHVPPPALPLPPHPPYPLGPCAKTSRPNPPGTPLRRAAPQSAQGWNGGRSTGGAASAARAAPPGC